MNSLRVVAVLAVRNEARFLDACLQNLFAQGVQAYVCDNESTDGTRAIAERYLGQGVLGVESIAHDGTYRWAQLLQRKEELFRTLDADWFLHADADEIHLPPPGHASLVDALADADARGYNTAEFLEFTFIPTRESPDHDHDRFQETLRSYYPFMPASPHCVRALKKSAGRMEIAWSGGHHVRLDEETRLYPQPFRMRHYQFLSAAHAAEKYPQRTYDGDEVGQRGWHGWRPMLSAADIRLPAAAELRCTRGDDDLDPSEPWTRHWLDRCRMH